jgi:hypothetical protein
VRPDTVYIDIRTSPITMGEVVEAIARLREEHPDEEIFMDGDLRAVVGRRRTGA